MLVVLIFALFRVYCLSPRIQTVKFPLIAASNEGYLIDDSQTSWLLVDWPPDASQDLPGSSLNVFQYPCAEEVCETTVPRNVLEAVWPEGVQTQLQSSMTVRTFNML